MSEQSKAVHLANVLSDDNFLRVQPLNFGYSKRESILAQAAYELRCIPKLEQQRDQLLSVLKELQESASYWSEYDVPLGIVDRINAAIAAAEGKE